MKSFLSFLLLIAAAQSALAYTPGRTYKITVLHTNDHHGHFFPNKDGEFGLAARATLINQIRSEVEKDGGLVLLLDAGDVNTGTAQSDVQDAEPDFKGMAKLGYDVMAIGNHEFDNPLSTIFKQRKWAGFPFISANIFYKNTNRLLFPSHIVKKFDDLNITVMGLTTEDTPIKSSAENTKNFVFKPAVAAAKKIVPGLRKNSDVLIALTHMGHYRDMDKPSNSPDEHASDAPGDVTLAREVNGIDLIVGGHSAKALTKPDIQNGTIIVQAKDWGRYLGRVDLEFLDGKISLQEAKLIPINLKGSTERIEADKIIEEFLRPFKEKGDAGLSLVVGSLDANLDGDQSMIRNQETNLGNFVTAAYKEKFKTDIGLSNSGGIRTSMYAGVLTLESIFNVHPFGNEVVTASLIGSELKTYLETLIAKYPAGSNQGGFPQISGVVATLNKSEGKLTRLMINGEELVSNRTYTMAISQYSAAGGDGYPKLNYKSFGFIDNVILREYVEAKKVIKANDYSVTNYITYE